LPFVYAVWAVRPGANLGWVAEALQESKRRGLLRAGPIAQREASRLGLDAGFCRRYLQNILSFDLGPREQAGLRRYHQLACTLDLAPPGGTLSFYEAKELQTAP
jgi:predicted solute-binding protein